MTVIPPTHRPWKTTYNVAFRSSAMFTNMTGRGGSTEGNTMRLQPATSGHDRVWLCLNALTKE